MAQVSSFDALRFCYNELNTAEQQAVEAEMIFDEELRSEIELFSDLQKQLNMAFEKPSPLVKHRLVKFAQTLQDFDSVQLNAKIVLVNN